MSDPFPHPRVLLARYGLAAKKSWGQNFLISERVYRAIVDATVSDQSDWVVEIGAGLGTLTMRLAERAIEGKVIAVERDPDMVRVLEGELSHFDNVEIAAVNALKYDLRAVARWQGAPITVCGNLPYHLSSQILFHVLAAGEHVRRAVVMLQKEMAERIVAAPGSKTYGALSVMIQSYAQAKKVVAAPRTAFVPAPKVDSLVIAIDPYAESQMPVQIDDRELHSAVVHAGFGQRRKTLRNSLASHFGREAAEKALKAAGIDEGRRAESLDIGEFGQLSAAFADSD